METSILFEIAHKMNKEDIKHSITTERKLKLDISLARIEMVNFKFKMVYIKS
ncbi:hypothetical protein C1645_813035 [Glomus cerebriforme]|uniref:Uncharacterized protein n=1 Tax=Glomus cerebriforme TaxID=658196 RepID=A0A397TTE7_9GLOM|nr:hypothetical protein C1645_813035 [Glomus cerebriforme]